MVSERGRRKRGEGREGFEPGAKGAEVEGQKQKEEQWSDGGQ